MLSALHENSVPAGALNDMANVFKQPQAEELVIRDEDGKALGVRQIAFNSIAYEGNSDDVEPLFSSPPEYGEHTEKILTEECSMTKEDIRGLFRDGIVE